MCSRLSSAYTIDFLHNNTSSVFVSSVSVSEAATAGTAGGYTDAAAASLKASAAHFADINYFLLFPLLNVVGISLFVSVGTYLTRLLNLTKSFFLVGLINTQSLVCFLYFESSMIENAYYAFCLKMLSAVLFFSIIIQGSFKVFFEIDVFILIGMFFASTIVPMFSTFVFKPLKCLVLFVVRSVYMVRNTHTQRERELEKVRERERKIVYVYMHGQGRLCPFFFPNEY